MSLNVQIRSPCSRLPWMENWLSALGRCVYGIHFKPGILLLTAAFSGLKILHVVLGAYAWVTLVVNCSGKSLKGPQHEGQRASILGDIRIHLDSRFQGRADYDSQVLITLSSKIKSRVDADPPIRECWLFDAFMSIPFLPTQSCTAKRSAWMYSLCTVLPDLCVISEEETTLAYYPRKIIQRYQKQ